MISVRSLNEANIMVIALMKAIWFAVLWTGCLWWHSLEKVQAVFSYWGVFPSPSCGKYPTLSRIMAIVHKGVTFSVNRAEKTKCKAMFSDNETKRKRDKNTPAITACHHRCRQRHRKGHSRLLLWFVHSYSVVMSLITMTILGHMLLRQCHTIKTKNSAIK